MRKALATDGEGEGMGHLTRRFIPALALAIGLALMAGRGNGDEIMARYDTAEATLKQILKTHASPNWGTHKVWPDIRTEPVAVGGVTHPGHIVIHATEPNGQCQWFMVVEPKHRDLYFEPNLYKRIGNCEYFTKDQLLSTGLNYWINTQVRPYFAQKFPVANPQAPLRSEVYYHSDRVTFVMKKLLRMKPLPSKPQLQKLPLQK
jgi:hypothetical protein